MTVRFPDLNTWHRVTDWNRFAAAYDYAACRATMGVAEVDGYFFDFLDGCRKWGIRPIAYHRLRSNMRPADQTAHFLRIVGQVGVAYALDVESTAGAAEPTMQDAGDFVDELVARTGRPRSHVLSYLPRWWYDAHGGGRRDLAGTLLWASRYQTPIDWSGYAGFAEPTIVQYSDDAPIAGVGTGDMNETRLDDDDLAVALGFKLSPDDRAWIEGALNG